jgi:hypothetical protein
MRTLTTIAALLALMSPLLAQNRGLVTDTNGNVISGRATNIPLSFTNPLTLTTLTNANGPNLVLADTNGTLTTGSVPSGAAPDGAVLTAVGGSGVFVGFKTVVTKTNSTTKTNLAATSTNAADDPELVVTLAAGSYTLEGVLRVTSTDGLRASLFFSSTTPLATGFASFPFGSGTINAWGTSSAQLRPMIVGSGAISDMVFFSGSVILTNTDTITVRWAQQSATTNPTTVLSNSKIVITPF